MVTGYRESEDSWKELVLDLRERGRVILLDSLSIRSRHLTLGHDTAEMLPVEPDRVSGNHRPGFPEPTTKYGDVWEGITNRDTFLRAYLTEDTCELGYVYRFDQEGQWCQFVHPSYGFFVLIACHEDN